MDEEEAEFNRQMESLFKPGGSAPLGNLAVDVKRVGKHTARESVSAEGKGRGMLSAGKAESGVHKSLRPANTHGHIYELVFPSGKSYVGQTRRWKRRMKEHEGCSKSTDGHLVKRAIRKYGWSQVKVLKLATVPRDELDSAECMWIAKRGTLSPGGYNLTPGGDAQPMHHPHVRQWQKERIGDAMRRPEVRAKKRALWMDQGYREMQRSKRTGSKEWMQSRRDCQNSLKINEKRRQTWARKRAEKLQSMRVEEGRLFMKRAMKHALRLAGVAANRIDAEYGRDPVQETREFWEREIAGYEATVWRRTSCLSRPLREEDKTNGHTR